VRPVQQAIQVLLELEVMGEVQVTPAILVVLAMAEVAEVAETDLEQVLLALPAGPLVLLLIVRAPFNNQLPIPAVVEQMELITLELLVILALAAVLVQVQAGKVV
jgi:hypothetical protein